MASNCEADIVQLRAIVSFWRLKTALYVHHSDPFKFSCCRRRQCLADNFPIGKAVRTLTVAGELVRPVPWYTLSTEFFLNHLS
jgi:hypothetical protein